MPIFTLEHYLPHDSVEAQAYAFVESVKKSSDTAFLLTHNPTEKTLCIPSS